MKKIKTVMVSGGFDPVHVGHVRMFKEAKALGGYLIVVINGDSWLKRKKGRGFMPSKDRAEIIREFKCVDQVYILNTKVDHVAEAIEKFRPDIFANGGDRKNKKDIPEAVVCERYGVKMRFNVGGGKIRSSSELLKKYNAKQ